MGYGDDIVETLAFFLHDESEDIWVRRHIPSTLALIPTQPSVDVLVSALDAADGFLRYKALRALGRLKREHPELLIPSRPIEALVVKETNRYFNYLGLHYNVVVRDPVARDTLLARALGEKLGRTVDRIYHLLELIYPWKDVAAARWTLEHTTGRARAGALEYLDNLLTGQMRKRVIPVLDDVPLEEKVRRGNLLLKSRVRDVEDSLAQLVHDAGPDRRGTAIHFVESRAAWALAGRPGVRARAPRRQGLVRVRGCVVGAGRTAHGRPTSGAAAGWSRCRPWSWRIGCGECRSSTTCRWTSCSASRMPAGRSGTSTGACCTSRARYPTTCSSCSTEPFAAPLTTTGTSRARDPPAGAAGVRGSHGGSAVGRHNHGCRSRDLPRGTQRAGAGMLAENPDLVHGLLRMAIERENGEAWRGVMRAAVGPVEGGASTDPLQPVEKILLMQELPVFARASAADVSAAAAIAREVRAAPGDTLFSGGDAPAIYLLVAGELALEPLATGTPLTAGPGDTVGVYETLSGAETTGWRAHVTRDVVALRIDREALFDLLAEHIGLLQAMFSAVLRRSSASVV